MSAVEEAHETTSVDDEQIREFCDAIDGMRGGMASVRASLKSLREREPELDTKQGISLLSLKHHLMLSYLRSLVLISSRSAIGHSLADRTPPARPFAAPEREPRGADLGDRVDSAIEARVVLEKIKVLEGRMKYQIDKLVRVAEEAPAATENVANDPLAFRPNPQALMDQGAAEDEDEDEEDRPGGTDARAQDGLYRPPKLAPVPYTEARRGKDKDKARRAPLPSALATLAHLDPAQPHAESTSGLGTAPALLSQRARELQRMTAFEEENMTRLVMKKRDARRRALDEADLALGGNVGGAGRRGRGGGLADEFGDILKSVSRSRGGVVGDGYEELRQKGQKDSVLTRSRVRGRDEEEDMGADAPRQRKRSRFDKEVKSAKRRTAVKKKA